MINTSASQYDNILSGRMYHIFKRLISNRAFAFDIDGVLLRGREPIKNAGKAINLLTEMKIPFVLLTNGGGKLESTRVSTINSLLQTRISPLQIVQSHTPFKTMVNKYDKILAVGIDSVKDVAERYGFRDVIHVNDIISYNANIAPFASLPNKQINDTKSMDSEKLLNKPFDAVLVFNDPRNWGADLQIINDILISDKGNLNTIRSGSSSEPSVPIFFSNNDLLWKNNYNLNRFGQGAFRNLVRSLYSSMNDGKELNDTVLGKPTRITYDFAHYILIDWFKKLQECQDSLSKYNELLLGNHDEQILPELGKPVLESPFQGNVYMVGDNPASDITGAQNYGWKSCLVRTGVYRDGDSLGDLKPTYIINDVFEAVTKVLENDR